MKFALCNEMFQDWALENQFEAFAAWGYDGAELAPFSLDPAFVDGTASTASLDRIDASVRRRIVGASRASGVAVSGLHWILAKTNGFHLTTPDASVRRSTSAYLARLAELCADLGGAYLVLGSPAQRNVLPNVSRDDAVKFALETISDVVPTLEKLGVVLALEALAPTETNFWTTASETLDFIEKLDRELGAATAAVALHLDCKAMSGGETTSIPDALRSSAARRKMTTFHANDPNLRGPGFGKLDFAPIMSALDEIGFDGWIGVEPFDYSPGVVRLGRDSLRYLKECAKNVAK